MKTILKIVSAVAIIGAAAAPAFAQNTATATGSSLATIISPLTITANAALDFGTVVKPATGLGPYTITVDTAGSHATSTANSYLPSSGATAAAAFTITGAAGYSANIVLGTLLLQKSGASDITVALTPSLTNPVTLNASQTLNVGGSFSLTDTQATGAYTGTFSATVTYN